MDILWNLLLAMRTLLDLVVLVVLGLLLWKLRDPKPPRRRPTRPNVRKTIEPGAA